jgi:iron complex outermembrane recepter protein
MNVAGTSNIFAALVVSVPLSAVTSITAASAAAADQQDSPAIVQPGESAGLQEIIVTARKQAERLVDSPVTVTAVGGSTLENFQIRKVEDLAAHVPTLDIASGGSGSGGQVTLRGVGSSGLSAAFDSAIAFDLDGIQVSTMRLVQSAFVDDVAQIEVLKGPQSLFFGKSASAGVISVQTADPTKLLEFGAKGAYEFVQHSWVGQGFVSGPISDTLGFRLAARGVDTIHGEENLAQNVVNHWRGESSVDVRGTLQWEPLDRFSANLKLGYNHFSNDGPLTFTNVTCGADGKPDPVSIGGLTYPAGYSCNTALSGKTFLPDPAPVYASSSPLPGGSVPFTESDIYFGRLKWDLDLSDRLKLSSVTGYVNMSSGENDAYSFGGVAPPGGLEGVAAGDSFGAGLGVVDNSLHQFSQELRLASGGGSWFNYMIGGFYEHRVIGFATAQSAVGAPTLAPLFGFATGPNGADPVTGYTYDWQKVHTTKTDTYSPFGSVTLDLTQQLQLSGGVRWTKEQKVNDIYVPYDSLFLSQVFGFVPSGFKSGPIHFSDSNWSPEASLRYKITDEATVYAAFKTGFKSGGIDNSALPSNGLLGFASPDPAVRAATANGLIFKSEEARGGEIGAKARLAERTLALNGSLYHYVFKNLQVQNFNGATVQFATTNAGQLTSQGADLDFDWQTPLTGLQLNGSIAYTDTKYTKTFLPDPVSAPTVDLNGRAAANAPKISGNFGPNLSLPIGSLQFGLNANARFTGSYLTDNLGPNDYIQHSFWTFDSNISIGSPDQKWKVALIGVNLGDKIYVIRSTGTRPFGTDDQVLFTNQGRQIFLEGSTKF